MNKNTVWGAAAVILSALLWSLDGVFVRPKLYALDAGLVVFIGDLLAFILLSPIVFLNWKKIKMLAAKDWQAILWVCFFGEALGSLMITQAFFAAMGGEVTFATVVILQKLQPVFALLMARLILGERLSKKFYLWAAAAVAGAYVLAFGKTGIDLGSVNFFHSAAWYSLVAAFAFGSSTVFGKRVVNHLNFQSTAALRFGIGAVIMLAYLLVARPGVAIGQITPLQWQLLLAIVFITGGGALFIYYWGLKRITASVSTICELAWPLSAVALDYFLNGNALSPAQWFAAIVMIAAFCGVVLEGQAKNLKFHTKVIKGDGRGRLMGYPTANLDAADIDLPHGVYKAQAEIKGRNYQGLLFFGFKETFGKKPSLEILLKGFDRDIYGEGLAVSVGEKIREIKRFANPEKLKDRIARDIEENL
jgi:drug/metabolite transporter (DMT)-like permease